MTFPSSPTVLLRTIIPGTLSVVARVENDSLSRIMRRNLDRRRARDVPDSHRLVEEERPGMLRARVGALHARLREHEQLRFSWHAQCLQNRKQVPRASVARERPPALRHRLPQPRDAIRRYPRGVLNAWMLVEDSFRAVQDLAGCGQVSGEGDAGRRDADEQLAPPSAVHQLILLPRCANPEDRLPSSVTIITVS